MPWYSYYNNNSGGYYWLDAEDYRKLGNLPNTIMCSWGRYDLSGTFCGPMYGKQVQEDWPAPWGTDNEGRPYRVYINANSLEDAIRQWVSVVGQDPDEEGCPCCGPPHSFGEVLNKDELKRVEEAYQQHQ